MTRVSIQRSARLPDDLRVARSLSAPHLGPRLLFFSGGSALNQISRALKSYTYNSAHLITPFDSGGSSQVLREAFDMPAVGDLRSRLMALADESDLGQPDIFRLFSHRLPKNGDAEALRQEVAALVVGKHPLLKAISTPMGLLIQDFLNAFHAAAPTDFDYRNASIGNLILAGGYLGHGRLLEPVLFLMSKMVDVRGTVRGVVDCNLHLGVELADGRKIYGQREISGKEAPPIDTPIARLIEIWTVSRDGTLELEGGYAASGVDVLHRHEGTRIEPRSGLLGGAHFRGMPTVSSIVTGEMAVAMGCVAEVAIPVMVDGRCRSVVLFAF